MPNTEERCYADNHILDDCSNTNGIGKISEVSEQMKIKAALSKCFDLYDLPGGECLAISKDDYKVDCIPALISSKGDVFGLSFSSGRNDQPKHNIHRFENGATGKFKKGDDFYKFTDTNGNITLVRLNKPLSG